MRCNYLDDAPPEQLANYVKYIGSRSGVERIDESKASLPATYRQRTLIQKILSDLPDTRDMHEYRDYILNPNRANASEFISTALEQNLNLIAKRENYVDYIANRPRVERLGEHGLFTDEGEPVVLGRVQEEVANREGRLWTHIFSLRREDAERLGFDSGERWRSLLRSKRALFSKNMNIPDNELKWYAAFHNEGHHPHVHMMAYGTGSHQGYMNTEGIEEVRKGLAHTIFQNDFMYSYQKKDSAKAALRESAGDRIAALARQARTGLCQDSEAMELLRKLALELKGAVGTMKYGYLKPPAKKLVDSITDRLAADPVIADLYKTWCDAQGEVVKTYRKTAPELPPLTHNRDFRMIKNEIIAEAVLLSQESPMHPAELPPPDPGIESDPTEQPGLDARLTDEGVPFDPEPSDTEEAAGDGGEPEGDEDGDWEDGPEEELPELVTPGELEDVSPLLEWSERYREARACLFGDGRRKQDFKEALRLLSQEALRGNALACHDLGRMYADGLGCEPDPGLSHAWYGKALEAFLALHSTQTRPGTRVYLAYRIGKLYGAGLGCAQDHTEAARWLAQAADAGNKYAQYSLGSLYRQGKGVEKDMDRARQLYERSAQQEFPYASYELARMCQEGTGGPQDPDAAQEHYADAFQGFRGMEAGSRDDKLQYRLGCMLLDGKGTPPDEAAAEQYLRQAASVGNAHAQYRLAKLALSKEERDDAQTAEAVALLEKAAKAGNSQAQYALGKLYRDGDGVPRDLERAATLLKQAAEQNNDYAAYALGKLYDREHDPGHPAARPDALPHDPGEAERWYRKAAALGNPYAQYRLSRLCLSGQPDAAKEAEGLSWLQKASDAGIPQAQYALAKLLLEGESLPKDIPRAIELLTMAAQQDRPGPHNKNFAAYTLGKLYQQGNGVERNIPSAEAWLRRACDAGNEYAMVRLARLCLEEYPNDAARAGQAVSMLERAAAGGSPQAQYSLARLLQEGKAVPKDRKRAAKLYLAAARQDNPYAAYALGKLFYDGVDASRDIDAAVRFFTQAARLGHASAQCRLGRMLLTGTETIMDVEAGLAWLQAAESQREPQARYLLAVALLTHEYVPRDPARARRLLTLAAEDGHAYAQYRLGKLLITGDAFLPDTERGVMWLHRAADQGNLSALYTLGIVYLSGSVVPRDAQRGMEYLRRAAQVGDPYAQYQLGKHTLLGKGTARNREEAILWLSRSAAQGNEYARIFLDHADEMRDPSLALSASRLLHHLSRIFDGTLPPQPGAGAAMVLIDSKRRRKLREKLAAAGHAADDSMESLK